MSIATPARLMTNDEFLSLPDDGMERNLTAEPDLPGFCVRVGRLFD